LKNTFKLFWWTWSSDFKDGLGSLLLGVLAFSLQSNKIPVDKRLLKAAIVSSIIKFLLKMRRRRSSKGI
jgi:hypothetical protein